ncbi:MAG: S49 family peptidase [Acidobacteria bacterium]|nr:S49 family peptidase [Acidobacteriota bacterium]
MSLEFPSSYFTAGESRPLVQHGIFAILEGWEAGLLAGSVPKLIAPSGVAGRIPIIGVLGRASDWFAQTHYEGIRERIRSAVQDPAIQSIVLHVDSPGGSVIGLPETAALIRQANSTKPVTAIVHGMAASAAYWLASAAGTVIAGPSAQIGSIGVLDVHVAAHRALEQAGLDVHVAASRPEKAERSGLTPLTDSAKNYMQGQVDTWYAAFLSDVRKGRGARLADPTGNYGAGRLLFAADAKRLGLIDFIRTESL